MSNTPVPIDPPISKPQPNLIYTGMDVQIMSVTLGVSARLNVVLFNADAIVGVKTYELRGDDYSNWGSDDTYIYNWVLSQLQNS
jgi:hypothetical protein